MARILRSKSSRSRLAKVAELLSSPSTSITLSPRIIANRINGSKGGRATFDKYGSEEMQRRGERGGEQKLSRYGKDVFTDMLKRSMAKRRAVTA